MLGNSTSSTVLGMYMIIWYLDPEGLRVYKFGFGNYIVRRVEGSELKVNDLEGLQAWAQQLGLRVHTPKSRLLSFGLRNPGCCLGFGALGLWLSGFGGGFLE